MWLGRCGGWGVLGIAVISGGCGLVGALGVYRGAVVDGWCRGEAFSAGLLEVVGVFGRGPFGWGLPVCCALLLWVLWVLWG